MRNRFISLRLAVTLPLIIVLIATFVISIMRYRADYEFLAKEQGSKIVEALTNNTQNELNAILSQPLIMAEIIGYTITNEKMFLGEDLSDIENYQKSLMKSLKAKIPQISVISYGDENGNYIGYHIEGGETFKNVGEVSLTKMNIDGTRPLFLCNNPKEWYPEHLPNNKDTYKVLKVVFKPIKEHVVTKVKDFNKLLLTERFDLQQQEVTQHYASKEMEKLLDDKIDLVVLSPDNDKK